MAALRRAFSSEFYLDRAKQFMYTPRSPLTFDETGKAPIYLTSKNVFKLRYLPKLYFANLAVGAIISSNAMLNFAPIITIIIGSTWGLGLLHSLTGCKVVKSVKLFDCGTKVEITYRLVRFIDRTIVIPVEDLNAELKSQLMLIWSLNPVPKNLISALELEKDLMFPCYFPLNHWEFLLFPKPSDHHKEAFVNAFNGVAVETTRTIGLTGLFKDRYKEIMKSQSDKA